MRPVPISFSETVKNIPWAAISAYHPEVVIGIARGGLVPAAVIAFRLGLPLREVRASLYDDAKPAHKLHHAPQVENISGEFLNQRVLLVDDVVKTGATLSAVKRILLENGAKQVKTLVLAGEADFACRKFEKCVKFEWEE